MSVLAIKPKKIKQIRGEDLGYKMGEEKGNFENYIIQGKLNFDKVFMKIWS